MTPANANGPCVHVLVINWNGLDHLDACFTSLLTSTFESCRFVLLDNASTDGSGAFVRERFGADPRVEIVECPANLGWSGGNNVGMKHALEAGADYLFLLNNDTAVEPDTIERLVALAEAQPEAGALAPKMLLYHQPFLLNSVGLECSVIASSWDRGVGRADAPRWDTPTPVIGACGGAMFIRAAALRKTGLLPEEFEIYLDDLDLCLRLWNIGCTILTCPEARVRHKFSATYGEGARARRKYFLSTRNRFYLMLRNYPAMRLATCAPAVALGEARAIGRALLDREPWRAAAHLRAWAAAAAYLPRVIAERQRRRAAGMAACRFWPLLRRRPWFCPRLVLPQNGWYSEIHLAGRAYRSMSASAWLDVPAGRLRLRHINCYPQLHPARIDVVADGTRVASLSSPGSDEEVIEVAAGRLEFTARVMFDAEATGEDVDLGGWIAVEPC